MKAYIASIKSQNGNSNGESNFINPKNYQVNLNMRSLRPLQREKIVTDHKHQLEFITNLEAEEPEAAIASQNLSVNALSDSSRLFLEKLRGKNHSPMNPFIIANSPAASTLLSLQNNVKLPQITSRQSLTTRHQEDDQPLKLIHQSS